MVTDRRDPSVREEPIVRHIAWSQSRILSQPSESLTFQNEDSLRYFCTAKTTPSSADQCPHARLLDSIEDRFCCRCGPSPLIWLFDSRVIAAASSTTTDPKLVVSHTHKKVLIFLPDIYRRLSFLQELGQLVVRLEVAIALEEVEARDIYR